MSLDFDLTKVSVKFKSIEVKPEMKVPGFMSYEKNGKRYMQNPITKTLIFATMSVGMGEITEDNALEFYTRYVWVNRVAGFDIEVGVWDNKSKEWTFRDLTLQDVRNHIGLRTNVSLETAGAWRKRIGEMYFKTIMNHAEADPDKAVAVSV